MNYISKNIKSKIDICIFNENYRDAAIHEQSHLEFGLILILSFLWNKNINLLESDAKNYCYTHIQRPSIGKIIDITRKLDINGEIFKNPRLKKFREGVNFYPAIRNEKMGHGYSFDDDAKTLSQKLSELTTDIHNGIEQFFGNSLDIIAISKEENNTYRGISFKSTGDISPWVTPCESSGLDVGSLYIVSNQNYIKISPFVALCNGDEFHIFSFIEDSLAARSVFNRLIKTGRAYVQTPSLIAQATEIDENRKKSPNGTIVNIYKNNYRNYIDTEIIRKIIKFLKGNESTVFATLWGHGGVGKTASIQRVCEAILNSEIRSFDYVVFVSAKDRQFNIYNGSINSISTGVDSFEQVIRFSNRIVFQSDSSCPKQLINFSGRILLILDDYETFASQEKEKIVEFVKALNISHHKVIITTRSANHITGEEIEVLELSSKETVSFFDSVLRSDLGIDPDTYKKNIDANRFENALQELTSGRPLFIFQSAMIYGRAGSINELLAIDLRGRIEAIEFLYGRIWDYLSPDAKRVFWAMGLLVTENDLSNVLSKLRYILNLEKDEHRFNGAIAELIKLKVATVTDNKFFRVYSSEISSIMRESAIDEGDAGGIKSRLQTVGSDRKLDSNLALLNDADSSRVTHKVSEVIIKYRHIISRPASPENIKEKAVVNLSQYLIEDAGDYDQGIRTLEEFSTYYNKSSDFVKTFSTYLWRGDDVLRKRAVDLVKNALTTNDIISSDDEGDLDLLCMLMRYESILLIESRQELKDLLRSGDIDEDEYEKIFSEQRHDFFRIYTYPGLKIVATIKEDKLKFFPHELKLKCLNGLSHFIDVCVRRKKFDDANEIFSYVFNNLKYNYHETFKQKLDRLLHTGNLELKLYDEYVQVGSIGDRFAKPEDYGQEISENRLSTQQASKGQFSEKLLLALNVQP
jgi:hypothetical protein